jgi:hypothetical protein
VTCTAVSLNLAWLGLWYFGTVYTAVSYILLY